MIKADDRADSTKQAMAFDTEYVRRRETLCSAWHEAGVGGNTAGTRRRQYGLIAVTEDSKKGKLRRPYPAVFPKNISSLNRIPGIFSKLLLCGNLTWGANSKKSHSRQKLWRYLILKSISVSSLTGLV